MFLGFGNFVGILLDLSATAGVGMARARLASTLIGQMGRGECIVNAGTRGVVHTRSSLPEALLGGR